jgi:hypothetical protein
MKWEMPLMSSVSLREPVLIQTPIDADFTDGIVSVITRMPFSRVVFLYVWLEVVCEWESLFLKVMFRLQ